MTEETEGSGAPVLNRIEQQRRFGVDCGDAIEFAAGTWAPGGEHVRRITVKNVSKRSIKFKYELPTTKYFSMDFPILTTLSPGMHTVLDVAFRPVRLEEYDDSVTFYVQIIDAGVVASSGHFRLPVLARIPGLAVDLPTGLDFGFCPTAETSERSLLLHNTGQVEAAFEWAVPGAGEHGHPFAVRPVAGHIGAGQTTRVTVMFTPAAASVFVATAVCLVRPARAEAAQLQMEKTVKISGISKFTHIAASETELNFGDILIGSPPQKRSQNQREFVLRNRSLVRASFRVVRLESDTDPVFFFSPTNGVIDPESSVSFRVQYTPVSAGSFTCDHFEIVTPGGCRQIITCKGRAVGPQVTMWKKNLESNFVSTKSINFGDVVAFTNASRVLTLRNESNIDVLYQLDCQANGVFEFDSSTGRIAAMAETNLTISFSPDRPGNFYRRFFILLQNQSPIYVDVLGTSFDDKVRPSPFQQEHIDAYRLRAARGLGLLSPDQLETYWQDNGDELFLRGALRCAQISRRDPESTLIDPTAMLTRSGEATVGDVEVSKEYFVSIEDLTNPIVISSAVIDFGNCGIVQFPSKQAIHVTNNTHGKVSCMWRVASVEVDPAASCAFHVTPEVLDISAGATAEFRVAFLPSQQNTYYFGELEAFVSFKSNRTFRLVNVETFTPPWSSVTKVFGNTFASPTEQFLPKLQFRVQKSKVVFPTCYLGDQVFQTITIENASDTPSLFAFTDDPSGVFSCKPSHGYVAAKSFQLVLIRFAPRVVKTFRHTLQCIVNNARATPDLLELFGICALPQLVVIDDSIDMQTWLTSSRPEAKVFIKPTSIGLASCRAIQIQNTSRVPLVYRWDVPSKYADVFEVTPGLGRLNGRETVQILCRFTPNEVRDYMSRFLVTVKPISVAYQGRHSQPTISPIQEITVRVITKGCSGAITFEPAELVFDTILVLTNSKQVVWINNSADCDLYFRLTQSIGGTIASSNQLESPTPTSSSAKLVFSEHRGCIPARSRKEVAVTFLPRVAGQFRFDVRCYSSDVPHDVANLGRDSIWNHDKTMLQFRTCTILAEASFPTVMIEDIRVPNTPTPLAWHQFFCSEINEYLSDPVMRGDSTAEGCSPVKDSSSRLQHFAFPFTPAPLGSSTETVYVKLRNPGSLVVMFSLKYPKEGNVEMEHWAETGAPSPEEVRTNAIVDSKLFMVSPRRAMLLPHQSVTITFTYSYASDSFGGVHDLPLILEVDKGKHFILELQGRTLPPNEPKLFVPQRLIHLAPVMIGEYPRPIFAGHMRSSHSNMSSQLLVQQIAVFNRGEVAFRLEVSSNTLHKLTGEFCGLPVLRCKASSEIVPARSCVFIDIEFCPVEAQRVDATVIIKAHGLMGKSYREVTMLRLVATSYHPFHDSFEQMRVPLLKFGPPHKQLAAIPGQLARFVSDYVDFGHVGMFVRLKSLLVLVNTSVDTTVSFAWDKNHALVLGGVISFAPQSGELSPGEQQLIHVSLRTRDQTIVVDHDVMCLLTYRGPSGGESKYLGSSDNNAPTNPLRTSLTSRQSVISRSTASQEAARGRCEQRLTHRGKSLPGVEQGNVTPTESSRSRSSAPANEFPLYAHIFAHVLPRESFDRIHPRQLDSPLVLDLDEHTSMHSEFAASSHARSRDCQLVVLGVVELLLTDVLASDTVTEAAEQRMTRLDCNVRAEQARWSSAKLPAARWDHDCHAILANVLENTVLNVLQELFYGDIEQELLCVPRKAVFPTASPRKLAKA